MFLGLILKVTQEHRFNLPFGMRVRQTHRAGPGRGDLGPGVEAVCGDDGGGVGRERSGHSIDRMCGGEASRTVPESLWMAPSSPGMGTGWRRRVALALTL